VNDSQIIQGYAFDIFKNEPMHNVDIKVKSGYGTI